MSAKIRPAVIANPLYPSTDLLVVALGRAISFL